MSQPLKHSLQNDLAKVSGRECVELKDRKIAIYLERYREYDPDRDQKYWNSRVVLAFCASDWTPIWEFPPLAGTQELFDSVQRNVADVDSFIDEVLAEGNEGKQ